MDKDNEFQNNKRGYLLSDFTFFNLEDKGEMQIESHYHDFNKVVVFIAGNVTYYIEGTAYKLKPWDILLVSSSTLHKPVIDPAAAYKRMVLWLKPSFLQKHSNTQSNLLTCFEISGQPKCNLLRMTPQTRDMIRSLLAQIQSTCHNQHFADDLLGNALFLQFIIYLNRLSLDRENGLIAADNDMEYDETVNKVLQYIDDNLAENLTIEKLASVFFLSKYYLMRKFKKHTDFSIHQYILQKRLIAANHLLRSGEPVLTACLESGFQDYANFTRAFKKMYGSSPKKYHNLHK
ncbi:AraC family transcriptional regulator [Sporomusa aerivorans]|uniref:AraC family transcriptional regulator n=1 Tax=Sporomusa aerivorans TaxID=204936 RepID=UPI00352B7F2E